MTKEMIVLSTSSIDWNEVIRRELAWFFFMIGFGKQKIFLKNIAFDKIYCVGENDLETSHFSLLTQSVESVRILAIVFPGYYIR